MKLVCITGEKEHGKGEVAAAIASWAQARGKVAVEHGFADAGKLALARIFWPEITMEAALKWANRFKLWPEARSTVFAEWKDEQGNRQRVRINGRQFFMHGLTEGGRDVHGWDVWVDILLPVVRIFDDADLPIGSKWWCNFDDEGDLANYALVSDMRFVNEAERCHVLSGENWKVVRPGHGVRLDHLSEQGIPEDLIDVTIQNDSTLEDLHHEVWNVCDARLREGAAA